LIGSSKISEGCVKKNNSNKCTEKRRGQAMGKLRASSGGENQNNQNCGKLTLLCHSLKQSFNGMCDGTLF